MNGPDNPGNGSSSMVSITDVQSQRISETRNEGLARLREKIREQTKDIGEGTNNGPSR